LEDDDADADSDDGDDTTDSEEDLNEGDRVSYMGKTAVVKEARGPNGTIGLINEGVFEMAERNEIEKLDEQILGFSPMANIGRLRQLAGIKEDFVSDEIDTGDDLSTLPVVPVDDMSSDIDVDVNPLDLIPDTGVLDHDSEELEDFDDDGGINLVTDSECSPAYDQIANAIDTIKDNIGDIKISEYKDLINSLRDLTDTIRNQGRTFLGESKK
jgi:hypothetical protein